MADGTTILDFLAEMTYCPFLNSFYLKWETLFLLFSAQQVQNHAVYRLCNAENFYRVR